MKVVCEGLSCNSVAVATDSFEAGAIEDCNAAAVVLNQPRSLEFVRRHRDSGSTGPEHLRQRLVSQLKAL